MPYLLAVSGLAILTAIMFALGNYVNPITVALFFLLFILFLATVFGSKPAVFASVLAMLCFNFFFLPPFGTLTISDPQNWVALFAFFVVAITARQLSAKAKRRAEEAERLYRELQEAFEKACQAEALKQSEKLKSALLDAVTHDLRTPLTSIKASVTMLLEEGQENAVHITLEPDGREELYCDCRCVDVFSGAEFRSDCRAFVDERGTNVLVSGFRFQVSGKKPRLT